MYKGDLAKLVLDLQRAANDPGPVDMDLAEHYLEAIEATNNWASHCGVFLRKGFRSEATRLAKLGRGLIHDFNLLMFPEQEAYNQKLIQLGAHLPSLDFRLVAEIDDALQQQEGVDSIVKQHRRAQMLRAPMIDRHRILSELTIQQSVVPPWENTLAGLNKVAVHAS